MMTFENINVGIDYEISRLGRDYSNWSDDYLNDLDTSQYPFPNAIWHLRPTNEVILKSAVMLFVGTIGIFLNSIILIILIKNKWLWNASNYLIGNLAFVDLLTLLFCPWFMLVRDFYQNFVLKGFGCHFEGFLQSVMMLASAAAVALVSYDRMAAAALTSEARITKAAAPKLICGSWILVVLISLPWIIKRQYVERQWLDYIEMYCAEDVKVLGIYWHFTLILVVWLPLGILGITYATILWRLECSTRKLTSRGGGQSIARAKGKAMRTTACVLLLAVICRIPYSALIYWSNNAEREINWIQGSYEIMWFISNYLIYLNAAVNPLIYGFNNIRFKRAMDKTPGIAFFRFGSWCCVRPKLKKKKVLQSEHNNTEKIFVIETPQPKKKIVYVIKNILHINKATIELSDIKVEEVTTKPTKVTPIKTGEVY